MAVERLTYTIPEAAQAIGIGKSILYRLINDGELRTIRLGKRVLIPRASILELLGMSAVASTAEEAPRFRDAGERTYVVTIRPALSPGKDRPISRYP